MNRFTLLTAVAAIALASPALAGQQEHQHKQHHEQHKDRRHHERGHDRHHHHHHKDRGDKPEPTPEPTPQAEAAPSFEETSNYENGADKDHFGPTLSAHAPGDPELAAHNLSPYNDWNINAMLSNHTLEKSQVVYTCEGGCLRVLPETQQTFTQWHHVGPYTITSLFDRVHEVIFHEPR